MHPEILRLMSRPARPRDAGAGTPGQAGPDDQVSPAAGATWRTSRRVRTAAHTRLRGRDVPYRGALPWTVRRPAGRVTRPSPSAPPEAVMTAPSAARDVSGMSGPRGMLTPEMSGRASSSVLVGRDEQMAALEAAFASVRQGGPSAVLLGRGGGRRQVPAGQRVRPDRGRGGRPGADRRLPGTWHRRAAVRPVHRGAARAGHEIGADALASMLPGRTTRGLGPAAARARRARHQRRPGRGAGPAVRADARAARAPGRGSAWWSW